MIKKRLTAGMTLSFKGQEINLYSIRLLDTDKTYSDWIGNVFV